MARFLYKDIVKTQRKDNKIKTAPRGAANHY